MPFSKEDKGGIEEKAHFAIANLASDPLLIFSHPSFCPLLTCLLVEAVVRSTNAVVCAMNNNWEKGREEGMLSNSVDAHLFSGGECVVCRPRSLPLC